MKKFNFVCFIVQFSSTKVVPHIFYILINEIFCHRLIFQKVLLKGQSREFLIVVLLEMYQGHFDYFHGVIFFGNWVVFTPWCMGNREVMTPQYFGNSFCLLQMCNSPVSKAPGSRFKKSNNSMKRRKQQKRPWDISNGTRRS